MKNHLFASLAAGVCLTGSLAGVNYFPNGALEGSWRPSWNRLAVESYALETPGWTLVKGASGQCLQSDGSGKPLELQFEAPTQLKVLLDLKGEKKSTSVTVTLGSYLNFTPLILDKKVFSVTDSQKTFTLVPGRHNRMRYRGFAPWKVTITPPKGAKITVDNIRCEDSKKAILSKVSRKAPTPSIAATAGELVENVPFTVKHYGNSSANVPFTVVLPFASGKFKCNKEWVGVAVRSADGKLFPAQGRIISRWPADKSVRALAVDAVAALKSGVNKMSVVPGKMGAPLSGSQKITVEAVDGEGISYTGAFTPSNVEFAGPVRRVVSGWMDLKAPGKAPIPVHCRMGFFKGIPDVEIEVSLHSPYENAPFVIRNAYASLDSGKKVKHHAASKVFVKGKKLFSAPHFLKGAGAIIMPQMSERHPAELQIRNSQFRIALWPDFTKQLCLSYNLVLTRQFVWSPDPAAADRFGYERTVAMAEPARYGETKFFLLPLGAVDRKNYPFSAKKIDETFQFRYSKPGQVKAGQTGIFDYGDLPGDGGWSNLESFKDYAELLRAVVCGDHDLLNFAYDRAIHYRDIDTYRGDSLYHSGNHVSGGFSFSHSWPQGIICHYLMTGDPRSKEVVEKAAASYLNTPITSGDIAGARSLSRYLLGLADFYGAVGDEKLKARFYTQVKHAEKTNLTPKNPDNTIFPWNGARLDPYQVWYGCCAFMEMYFLSGDKILLDWFRREMKASLSMDFYTLDLQEMWPGVTPAKGWPIQLGFNSRHRGSLLYPALVFLSQIDKNSELLTIAQRTALADWCSGTGYGGDSLEFFRLCVLTGGIPEAQLLKEAEDLIFTAAASEIRNGDFSKSDKWFTHWNLHALRHMGYDSAVNEWPLVKNKDFKKLNKERMERFSSKVSPWRYYARLLGYLDTENYGKAAPSLRVHLTSDWALGRTAVVGGAYVRMTPGKWRWSLSYNADKNLGSQSFFRLVIFEPGKPNQFLTINMAQTGKADVKDIGPVKSKLRNRKVTIKAGTKPGWKDLEFTFDLPRDSVARPMVYLYLAPGEKNSFIWLDDIKLEKISKR